MGLKWALLFIGLLALGGCRLVFPPPEVQRGEQLYRQSCQSCHGDRSGAGRLPYAPPHNEQGHTWHHSDGNLIALILDGSGPMGEMMRQMQGVPADAPRMPAFRGILTEDDARAILAYLKTWWTPEQRRFQERTPMMP
ncbi:MAG: hypothetical protein KatS3mg061_0218 [Dehalococcoidia bacterium]|nr:MAG: hypothetical protein KatS3mg061_0218 [Dehalococcoidia bacterium]